MFSKTLTPRNASPSMPPKNSRRQVSLICISNIVAIFDFLIYIYLAVTLSEVFFPFGIGGTDTWINQLQIYSLTAIGYTARPLGGLLIGYFGDKYGRKPALRIGLGVIAATAIMSALLPTYAQVGIVASLLFILVRLIQGMAFGAQAPLSWVFVAEHVNGRSLAFYCGVVMSSFVAGTLMSISYFYMLENTLTQTEMVQYGWRIAFFTSAVMSLIVYGLWRVFHETPLYKAVASNAKAQNFWSYAKQMRRQPRQLFLATALCFIQASVISLLVLLLPQLIELKFSIDPSFLASSHVIGLIFMMIGCIFFGLLADRIGLGETLMLAALVLGLQTMAFYYHLLSSNGEYILPMYALLGFCGGITGICPAVYVQLFPTVSRLTAVSIIYNLMLVVTGALIPFVLLYVTDMVSLAPALFIVFICIVAIIIGLYLYRLPTFHFNKFESNDLKKSSTP